MVEQDCGAVPVVESYETGRPVGVVTDRDITCRAVAEGRNPLELTAGEVMSQGCVTISAAASVADCCAALEQHQVRRVVVVDDAGACCGIVSQADIARHSKQKAGEVVREVSQPAVPAAAAPEGGPGRDSAVEETRPPSRTNEAAATAPARSE
jgi:signal-transduction protein with cAMP-binding, CBS, and nucleotidyltransferase domain